MYSAALQSNLDKILPPDAVAWLMDVWQMSQVFDDVADGDAVERADLDRAIWAAFVSMPGNPFFAAKAGALLPMLAAFVLKWQASDTAERAGNADARSYMWRAGFYDLVLLAVNLCHGPAVAREHAAAVLGLYGETLADYLGEISHA
jgi:hypothetical protein